MSSGGWDLERPARSGPSAGRGDLGDILERVLDKGVVIAGDVAISLLDIELLTIKLRLLVASADTAKAMGIDWWERDAFLTGRRGEEEDEEELRSLRERVARLEAALVAGPAAGAGDTSLPDRREEAGPQAPPGAADGNGAQPAPSPVTEAEATPQGNGAGAVPGILGTSGGSAH